LYQALRGTKVRGLLQIVLISVAVAFMGNVFVKPWYLEYHAKANGYFPLQTPEGKDVGSVKVQSQQPKPADKVITPQEQIHQMTEAFQKAYPHGHVDSNGIVSRMMERNNQVFYTNAWPVYSEDELSPKVMSDRQELSRSAFRSITCNNVHFSWLLKRGVTVAYQTTYRGRELFTFVYSISDC